MTKVGVITIGGRVVGSVEMTVGKLSPTLASYEAADAAPGAVGRSEYDPGMLPTPRHHGGGGHAVRGSGRSTTGPERVGPGDDPRGLEGYIREQAAKNRVDPDAAVRVAKSEGLRDFLGDHGKSGGAFQLYTGGGLGNKFQAETGLNPLDPANEKATIDWAMKNVGKTGWAPWHGARRVGVRDWDGIGGNQPSASSSESTSVTTPYVAGQPGRVPGVDPAAFIMHHTGGGRTPQDIRNTLNSRGLGVEYIMDREGKITRFSGAGAAHMLKGWGRGEELNNNNTVGMEVIAKDDKDVTPAQVAAAKAFIESRYPNTPVMGHGEVNPGHKEADEGMTIVNAIRGDRARQTADAGKHADRSFDPETMAP
jgi:hypothetical protein